MLPVCCQAALADGPSVTVQAYGLYTPAPGEGDIGQIYRQDTLSKVMPTGLPRLLRQTDHIPARPCVHFGIQFMVNGDTTPNTILLVQVMHPIQKNPAGREATTETYEIPSPPSGQSSYTGFSFDHSWEMTPGPWVFTLQWGGKILARQTFIVERPSDSAAPPSQEPDCGSLISLHAPGWTGMVS